MVFIFHCTFITSHMSPSKEDFSPINEFDKKSKLFIANGYIFVPFCKIMFSHKYCIAIQSLKEMQFNYIMAYD